jgi:TolB protein
MKLLRNLTLGLLWAGCSFSAYAELNIEITQEINQGIPVAVVPFATASLPVDISGIVNTDLSHSGVLKMLPESSMISRPSTTADVRFPDWQALGQNYLVIGQATPSASGQYAVQFQLFDVNKGEQILGYKMSAPPNELRLTAHHISDLIYEKITGKKSVFSGRISYVTSSKQGNKNVYNLQVADADGASPQTVTTSVEPLMSPSWSPDGKKMAYVSFERKTAAIYVQTLATGERVKVAEFPGINGAPAWSPDGQRLALTLSKDGSADIYVLNLVNRALTKVSNSFSIDTEPSWSPDGNNIVFTSDRGGKPQLYLVSAQGGEEKRLTFQGDYNARGSFSPDGKHIVMVHANGSDYRIAVMDLASRSINVLTNGPSDESPSFAPNSTTILYASKKGRKGFLSAVSIDGKMQQNMTFNDGEVREPAWAP